MSLEIPGYEHPRPRQVPLETIEALAYNCTKCELCMTRNHVVFGEGNPHARVMLIGEAPGANEDLQGKPFVGAAGKNLDGILSRAGINRDEIYIANILKCRPPANRDPRPEETLVCTPFLREQIRSIWPDIIVTMGNPATHFVLKTERGITKLRGQFYRTGHFLVMPTLHPAAAKRNPKWQTMIEEDFGMLGSYLRNHPANLPITENHPYQKTVLHELARETTDAQDGDTPIAEVSTVQSRRILEQYEQARQTSLYLDVTDTNSNICEKEENGN